MDISEFSQIEAQLPGALRKLPSPDQMTSYHARVRQERNEYMGTLAYRMLVRISAAISEIRRIAVACTAARLHLEPVQQ
jgi:hypothetical protein